MQNKKKEKKRVKVVSRKAIPEDIKAQVDEIVRDFNRKVIRDPNYFYVTRYKGEYLYLDRYGYGRFGPICQLKYRGSMQGWEFAIYKYSKDRYDPDEWMFPGSDLVDGTIEGAMNAGLQAYP
jgi:hypothetical protein